MDQPGSATPGQQQLAPLLLAVLGSVCGTLVARALETTEQWHLIGAALGAGIPPLVAVVGPYTRLRAAAAVLVSAAALAVTYGGFTLSEVAVDSSERTFPVPQALAHQEPSPTGSSTSSAAPPSDPAELCDDDQCVAWAPTTLRCSASSCDEPVRVRSTGTSPVRLTAIHIHEAADGAFQHRGTCSPGQDLEPGDECEIEVVPSDSPETTAVLHVHQDLAATFSLVQIERTTDGAGGGGGEGVELALEGPAECGQIVVGGGVGGGDSVTVSATVTDNGAADRPDAVLVRLSGEGGIDAETATALDTRALVAVDITLLPEHYGRQLAMTLTVDPAGEVPEADEEDNELQLTVTTPQAPGAGEAVCS